MLHTLMGKKNTLILAGAMLCVAFCNAQEVEQVDSVLSADLDEVVVTSAGSTRRRHQDGFSHHKPYNALQLM